MSSSNVISIAKATSTGSRIIITDMPADSVVIHILICWAGKWTGSRDIQLTEDAALVLLDALKEWESAKEPFINHELIAKFAMQE